MARLCLQGTSLPPPATGTDTGVMGKAVTTGAAALASAGEAAGALHRKYAPAALGGTGADAVYSPPSRTGAGVGADPYQGDVEGLHPAPGTPADAPVQEASSGGEAGSIAGIAAAVASGQPEAAATRDQQQVSSQPPHS